MNATQDPDPDPIELSIAGLRCANCAVTLEKALVQVPGVTRAAVNFASETARVHAPAGAALRGVLVAAEAADQGARRWVRRFDPRWWLVDFPRPMMASVVSDGPDSVVMSLEFQRRADLAGLIWESADRWSHPLLALETARDYRGTTLAFRWTATGAVEPLDAVNGPVLTIEGRDADGAVLPKE